MRVFITTDAVGGVWHYCLNLAAELVRGGDYVRLGVIGPAPSSQQVEIAQKTGASLVTVDAPLDWHAGGAGGLRAGQAATAAAAADWHAGIIHVNQPAYAAGAYPAPVVAVAHSCVETWWRGTHGHPAPDEWEWHRRAVCNGLRAASAAVAPTRSFAATLQEAYGLDRPPIAVLNGVAVGGRPASKGEFVLASGRVWDSSKDFQLLDAAGPAIRWPVCLAGECAAPDGPNALVLRNLCCLGHLGPDSMARQYAAAPIYVSTSLCEPFGLGVLEAASAGAALVLSDIPTFRELWDGAALFFGRRDPDMLAAAANRLIGEPQLRRRMAAAASRRAERYAIAATAQRMRAVYAQAMAPARTRVSA